MFDPNKFLSETVTEPMESRMSPVPEGEYPAIIEDVDLREVRGYDHLVGLDLTWRITDENIARELGRDTVTVRQSMLLEVDSSGGLATGPGKNIKLGAVREAVGQNEPGAWAIGNLKGAGPALVRVRHRPDKNDPETVYSEVVRVGKIT